MSSPTLKIDIEKNKLYQNDNTNKKSKILLEIKCAENSESFWVYKILVSISGDPIIISTKKEF